MNVAVTAALVLGLVAALVKGEDSLSSSVSISSSASDHGCDYCSCVGPVAALVMGNIRLLVLVVSLYLHFPCPPIASASPSVSDYCMQSLWNTFLVNVDN